jgi:hypothetical protein
MSSPTKWCCWHDAARVGDDERVEGIGLGLAGVEVGDPPHHQPGQIRDQAAPIPGHREGQGADGGRLVDHHEHDPMLGLQFAEDLAELGFAVGQPLVESLLPAPGDSSGVMFALADVRPGKTPMSLTSITCVLWSSPPGRPTAPIAASTLRRASRPANQPVVMPLISGLSMPPEPVTPPPRPYVQEGGAVMPVPEAGRPFAGPPRR